MAHPCGASRREPQPELSKANEILCITCGLVTSSRVSRVSLGGGDFVTEAT